MNFDKLLVSTKFAPPRIGTRTILRKQLLDQLRRTRHSTLTLVTGSAGFGKTTLLAQWRQDLMKAGAEVAWLSLSHDDKLLPGFCVYLFAAMQRLGIPVDDDMLLEDRGSESMEGVIAALVSGAANLSKELYLILDDYHHVDDQLAHRLMQKLLDHCPGNLHIIIASRVAPALSIGRLRVMGQVAEVECAELPFDLDETRAFIEKNLSSIKLSPDELRLIHDLTNGWPASLQLIAIMLKSRPEARSTLNNLVWKSGDLQAYLAEDVVAHLPVELSGFMEAISICRRFNAGLAEFVTENPLAADLLKQIEDENLLMFRVDSDDRSPWYRFHPLFAEFLAIRLERRGMSAVSELHRRAGRWFADNDLLVEAVRHASLGGDLEFAVEVIERSAPATWSLGYISPLLLLLDRLPQETLFAHPRLFFLGCLTFALTARPAKAEKWIQQLQHTDTAKNPGVTSWVALVNAAVALQRDDTKHVIDLLEPIQNTPLENPFLRYVFLAVLSTSYVAAGRHADVRRIFDGNPIATENRNIDMALVAESSQILSLLIEGKVKEVVRTGSDILARAVAAYGRQSVCANLTEVTLADAYYELDRIDDAREALANRTGILQSSSPEVMIRATLCRARLDLLQESPDAAVTFLERQTLHFRSLGLDRAVTYMLAEQVSILLGKGDRARAAELVEKLNELGATHRDSEGFLAEISVIAALARARLSQVNYQPEDALAALSVVRQYGERSGRGRLSVLANLLAAITLDHQKRHEEANQCLTLALQAGCRFGLVRTFVDEGKIVGEKLTRLATEVELDEPTALYLKNILARFTDASHPQQSGTASGTASANNALVSLTPRELEILGLIAQSMSNKRIALTLNISLETVKWNMKNIFVKLDVSSRYDAMTWARKQGHIT
ncbi:LuxR family transcriptional regulator, maltose regulon positive regulatory protein [Collimonas sp. OK307]|uniref:LuxR C-terminal-related transcriptional regulator n=1 Tax=Collimonas sp. OK307 TaxID=1801620 RepID=UPI0008EA3815|nr:LuxR C-terminal-related transcriptional regulator [Collimonas sp. OK307]SFI00361.1 LuxR family transcriptional regulator, maltose regulon positive regulatory protein [Collimonas sp. OK307]